MRNSLKISHTVLHDLEGVVFAHYDQHFCALVLPTNILVKTSD